MVIPIPTLAVWVAGRKALPSPHVRPPAVDRNARHPLAASSMSQCGIVSRTSGRHDRLISCLFLQTQHA